MNYIITKITLFPCIRRLEKNTAVDLKEMAMSLLKELHIVGTKMDMTSAKGTSIDIYCSKIKQTLMLTISKKYMFTVFNEQKKLHFTGVVKKCKLKKSKKIRVTYENVITPRIKILWQFFEVHMILHCTLV